jgi:hypothetical protein
VARRKVRHTSKAIVSIHENDARKKYCVVTATTLHESLPTCNTNVITGSGVKAYRYTCVQKGDKKFREELIRLLSLHKVIYLKYLNLI